jgi:hypothetical protein
MKPKGLTKAVREEPRGSFPIDMGISHQKLVLGTSVNKDKKKGRAYEPGPNG